MAERAPGEGEQGDIALDMLTAPEYGLLDKVHWVLGLMETFSAVYPQLEEVDLTTQAADLEVPVYFLEGRHDVNAMTSLVEAYHAALDAPHKEIIWFEKSGHTPLYEQSETFVEVLVNRVLGDRR
jgi:pimeloyl-ACP methyl ester carboxylesterase